MLRLGRRILFSRYARAFGSTKAISGVLSAQVGFMLPIGEVQGAYYTLLLFALTELKSASPNSE
jgi:hypothetical protein